MVEELKKTCDSFWPSMFFFTNFHNQTLGWWEVWMYTPTTHVRFQLKFIHLFLLIYITTQFLLVGQVFIFKFK